MAEYIEIEAMKNAGLHIIRQMKSGKVIPVSYEELSSMFSDAGCIRATGEDNGDAAQDMMLPAT